MTMHDREGLIARIRQIRRVARPPYDSPTPAKASSDGDKLRGLEARVAHLEQLVQGLQDSVHRESTRQGERIAELEARTQPSALGRALSEDQRNRGL